LHDAFDREVDATIAIASLTWRCVSTLADRATRRLQSSNASCCVDSIPGGAARIDDIALEAGISHHVGVSPKTLARVMRFRRVVDELSGHPDWADLATKYGYYDQSHLIADFRELAGATPNAFHFSNP